MNDYIFDLNIDKLKEVFGDRFYGENRKELIWNAVKNLSDDWFIATTNKFLSYSKQAPLPGDFYDAARIERGRNGTQFEDPKGTCGKCDDGIILARNLVGPVGLPYVFVCECHVGSQRKETYPRWSLAFSKSYEIDFMGFTKVPVAERI
jgi:hypothetical protein